jgi:large subunit ribosomal protein L3
MKMAGHMGCKWRIQFGLKVWRINNKYNILYVQGPVIPGPTHCYVRVVDSGLPHSREKLRNNPPPFPTLYIDEKKKLTEEIFDPQLFQFTSPTLKFENVEIKKQVKREGAKLAKIKN